MATRTIRICDFLERKRECGREAVHSIEVKVDGKRLSAADVCAEHKQPFEDAIAKLGLAGSAPAPRPTRKSSTKPKTFKAASGTRFTAKDARAWLVEQGELEENSTGIIAKDKIKLYADAH